MGAQEWLEVRRWKCPPCDWFLMHPGPYFWRLPPTLEIVAVIWIYLEHFYAKLVMAVTWRTSVSYYMYAMPSYSSIHSRPPQCLNHNQSNSNRGPQWITSIRAHLFLLCYACGKHWATKGKPKRGWLPPRFYSPISPFSYELLHS